MGGDGGSIPNRYDLVDMYAKFGKQGRAMVDPLDAELPKWETCAITKESLQDPIVCCDLGYLFNKEAVIQRLLDKTLATQFPQLAHIRSLKDLYRVKFTENPAYNVQERVKGGDTQRVPRFLCPVTMVEINGKHKFSALRTCGCVFADSALKEVGSGQCMECGVPFTLSDAIRLNPSAEERDELRTKLEQRREAERAAKKEKQRTSKKTEGTDGPAAAATTTSTTSTSAGTTAAAPAQDDGRKRKPESEAASTAATAAAAAAALDAQKKKHRLNTKLPEMATQQASAIADAKKAGSAVYASLFSSSSKK